MLVLSRRPKETLVFPLLSIQIEILKTSANQVRIGVDAPKDIEVVRGELYSSSDQNPIVPRIEGEMPVDLEAVQLLNQLRTFARRNDWVSAEPLISSLFRKLSTLQNPTVASKPPSSLQKNAPRRHALLVDDNECESRLLASYLRVRGFDVDVACDGRSAMLQMTDGRAPDIVLLDMNMPEFDGRWTITQIRRSRRFSDAKVFAVSGMEPQATGVEIGPMGVDQWFTKPLNPEALVNAITQEFETTVA